MSIELNEKVAEMARELANSMGMSIEEVINKIVEWHFEDCSNGK